jgi:hypothetical protein
MYGYGYRYPRVPRRVEALYADPEYRFRWTRAAIGNRAVAAKSPWIAHLKQSGVFDTIRDLLRKEAVNYRIKQGGVKDTTKKGAKQQITKLQRAIEALKDQANLSRVQAELGSKYSQDYVNDSIKRLEQEIANLNALLNWQPPGQQQQQQQQQSVAKGYGLLSGLGYGEGYGEGYGYFY